jgi:ABC-type branched-subunit amino acid transport system ATPase component/sugar phosphate permease
VAAEAGQSGAPAAAGTVAGSLPGGLVGVVEATREQLREDARCRLGVTGTDDVTPPLRATLRTYGVSAYPLVALGVLAIVDLFQGYAFTVLTPEIGAALGVGVGGIAAARAVSALASAAAPLPMAALTQRRALRAALCIVTGIAWSLVTLYTGLVLSLAGLIAVLVLDGLSTGSVGVLHYPLLMDSYPPPARVRVLSAYNTFGAFGNVLSPLLVGLFSAVLALTWRGNFVLLGILSVCGALVAVRLRDPGFGRWDTEQLRVAVRQRHSGEAGQQAADELGEEAVTLGFFEACRRLLLIRTVRRTLAAVMVFGVLSVPFATFLSFFLEERWNLGPGARGVFYAFISAVSIAGLLAFGRRGERMFARDPARVTRFSGITLALAVLVIAAGALMPVFWLMVALFAVGQAMATVLSPALNIVLLSVMPARQRPHAAALSGIFAAAGALLGAFFLTGINARFGIAGSLVALIVPGVAGALIMASTGRFVLADLDRMIDEVVEDEEIRQLTAGGGHLPMLSCRGLDFSYGRLQVLFDVDFTVDDGEMVALLGVNGAGKSTLLKAISGIGLPSAGSVRYRGQDITYLDAERRLRLGITQVPGGRAVFGPMSVVDNLRAFGYSLGRDRRALDGALDACFQAFPRLAERRNQNAITLSGGEQQMLGLAKALILRPRLLLIDELSLGLAPVIVEQLLEMVRRINADGTAVVLVEQSVNIALGLVTHAYFMEKGEIRFDGRAQDLLGRDDLLRAVFLGGAAQGRLWTGS